MAEITYSLIHKRDPRSGGGQTVRADTEPPPTPDDPTNYDYIADVIQDGTVVPGAINPSDATPGGAVVYVAGTNSLRQATVQEQRDHATNQADDETAAKKAQRRAQYDEGGLKDSELKGIADSLKAEGVAGITDRKIGDAIQTRIDAE